MHAAACACPRQATENYPCQLAAHRESSRHILGRVQHRQHDRSLAPVVEIPVQPVRGHQATAFVRKKGQCLPDVCMLSLGSCAGVGFKHSCPAWRRRRTRSQIAGDTAAYAGSLALWRNMGAVGVVPRPDGMLDLQHGTISSS